MRIPTKVILSLAIAIALGSPTLSANEWYEGYKLEPYWQRPSSTLVRRYDDYHILDLTKNIVVARGEASVFAYGLRNKNTIEGKAVEDTLKALYDTVCGIRISTNTRVSSFLGANPSLEAVLKQHIGDSYRVMHYRIFTMRGVLRVTASVKYAGAGGILELVYPFLIPNPDTSALTVTGTSTLQAEGRYTGLIIDARGLKMEPALDPCSVDTEGVVVLPAISDSSDMEALKEKGKVGYASSLNQALAGGRAGKVPLIVKATGSRRECDPIVSAADAEKIIAEDNASGFISRQAIVFVI